MITVKSIKELLEYTTVIDGGHLYFGKHINSYPDDFEFEVKRVHFKNEYKVGYEILIGMNGEWEHLSYHSCCPLNEKEAEELIEYIK